MTTRRSPARPLITTLALGAACAAGALSAGSASAAPTPVTLVSNYQGGNVYLLDPNYAWARTYTTVGSPRNVAISPDGNFAAVDGLSGSSGGKASIINLVTHAVTDFDYSSLGSQTQLGNPVFSGDSRYVFFGQRNPLLPLTIHRIDLSGTTPTSQTAQLNSITNCGETPGAMQVVNGVERLWLGCYNSTALEGVANLFTPTFAPTVGLQWTLGYSNTLGMAISPDQTTAYLATFSSGVRKVTLSSGQDQQINATNSCQSIVVDSTGTYAYAACGSYNSTQNILRIPTSGVGSTAINSGGAPVNGLRIAFTADRTQILQPGVGMALTGGTSLYRWTVSALGGSGVATTATTTPAFNAPYGVAAGTRAAAPDAPTGTTAVAGNAEATVSWTAPLSDGGSALTGYTVTAAPGGATCTATPPQTTCTVTGLTNGTAYTFSVVATNAIGSSPASSASAAVTPEAPAPAPSPAKQETASGTNSGGTPSGGSSTPTATLAVNDVAGSNQTASVTITSRVRVNGAGRVRQAGTRATTQASRGAERARAREHAAVLCTASRRTPRAGTYRMTCTLGAAARTELAHRSIRVRLVTTFTPTSGASVARSQVVVLKKIPSATPKVTG